jgi:putative ABC transport system ATP-binding protein
MEEKKPLVILKDVCKTYQRGSQTIPVLSDINLEILDGDFLALMGPSGSGRAPC